MTTLLHAVDGFLFGLLLYVFIIYLAIFQLILPAQGGELDDRGEVQPGLDERIMEACGERYGPVLALVGFVLYPLLCMLAAVLLLTLVWTHLDTASWLGVQATSPCSVSTRFGRLSHCMDARQWLGIVPATLLCGWVHLTLERRRQARRLAAWEAKWTPPPPRPTNPPTAKAKPKKKSTRR